MMKGFVSLVCFLCGVVVAHSQPVIISQPQSLTVNAGSAASLTVSASDGNHALTFQWQGNGVNLTDGAALFGSTGTNLVIYPVATGDSGAYSVIVSSTDGSTSSQTAQLTVLQGTIVNFQISGFGGGPSNLVIELFDHDKPATVENFIHFITSGAYTNMFFDRLVPNFVIQGGDWSTSNRTSTTPGLDLIDNGIYNFYVSENQVTNPPLPARVDSEYSVGPFIPNTYGTVAMALQSGNSNSAASAFYINLADNSGSLDLPAGDFTVFGRVITASNLVVGGVPLVSAGTNLLNYFNNTNYFSPPAQGIFNGSITANLSEFAALPVNFDGTNQPADDNLFYVDFTFLTNSPAGLLGPVQPPVDTTPPTAAITYPTANLLLTNGSLLILQGTASDNVGLALVNCTLVPLNGANGSQPFGVYATGTTNWSLNAVQNLGSIPPGSYNLKVVAQDGAGNFSADVLQPFTITAILTNGYGAVVVTNTATGEILTNGVGAALQSGVSYTATAVPAAGQEFLNWVGAAGVSVNPSISFVMSSKLLLTATFISNGIPGAIAFTYPPPNSQLTNSDFSISGTLSGLASAELVFQLFSQATGKPVGQSVTNNETSAWSLPITNLANLQPGMYIIQVTAKDPQGQSTVISEAFTLTTSSLLPVITNEPQSLTINAGAMAVFKVGATNTTGGLTYQWQVNGVNLSDGGDISGSSTPTLTVGPAALTDAGAYSVIVGSAYGYAASQPAAQLTVLQGTIVNLQISGFGGGPSNLVIELFDHDKPATVENFIHYITSGAYTNMFFDRLIPNFVIQGGDWSTSNRTSTTPGLELIDDGIYNFYAAENQVTNPPLPAHVDSEYSVGPLIPNTYGTVAMALQQGNPNSASSAFYINLADNSGYLDYPEGDFTVFGRVISASNLVVGGVPLVSAGTNLLNYFNNTNFFSAPAQGLITNLSEFAALPVNFDGTNQPADDNLFYADFTFLTNSAAGLSGPARPPVDTTPPTAAITHPTTNLLLTNGSPLVVQGTASDNVGLALVKCTLVPLNGANDSQPFGDYASGTTNWSLDFVQDFGSIPPGSYNVQVDAQDGAGNFSADVLQPFTITAILTNGYGAVTVTNTATGEILTNGVGAALQNGVSYTATAIPAAGQEFLNWVGAAGISVNASISFVMSPKLLLTATFISNGIPGAIAFTYPPPNSQLTNGDFSISGTLSGIASAELVFQLFSQATGNPIGQSVSNNATSAWSLPITNLANLQPGMYIIQVTAQDPQGRVTVISEAFTLTTSTLLPVITSEPQSLTINAGSMAVFKVGATNTTGGLTYQWQVNGVNLSDGGDISGSSTPALTVSPAALTDAGAYSVIVGSAYGLATSQPAAQLTLLQGTIINFQLSGFASGPSNVVVELFDHDKPATVENFIHYITSGAYTNMFFDRLVPGFVLQGGDWSASDRTNSMPPVTVLDDGIYDLYVLEQAVNNPPLPEQVDSEFSYGPFISNTYGTLAMALQGANSNSAANAFYFNLADNPILDGENGHFTVFGRVINPPGLQIGGATLINAGTNLLNYFNDTNFFSSPASGIYTSNPQFSALPVNYNGTNAPANTNLFYVAFTFLTNSTEGVAGPALPPVDTNPPAASITFPASALVLSNGSPFVAQGTASDNVGLARVYCFLNPQNGANQSVPIGTNALGTANWSVDFTQNFGGVPPGEYLVEAISQDGEGNTSSPVIGPLLTVSVVIINGNGTVKATEPANGSSTPNAVGAPLQNGVEYITQATPAAGQAFVNWAGLGVISLSPSINFVMASNLVVTASFVPNDFPGSLAITYPPAKSQVTNNDFMLSGTISGGEPAQITFRVFSKLSMLAIGQSFSLSSTASWSAPVTNLATLSPGEYIVQAVASDSQGRSTVVTNDFTVMAKLTLVTNGAGTISLSPTSNPLFPYLVPGGYTAKAQARAGSLFYNWNDGVNVSLNPVESISVNTTNLTLTATFVSNDLPKGLAFTYPAANAKLKQPASLPAFVAAGKAPASSTNVTYQLFSQASKLAVGPAISVSPTASGAAQIWSLPVTNLAPGNYTAIAVAYDSQGRSSLISENFDLLAPLQVQIQGVGTVSPNLSGQYLVVGQQYSIKAIPGAGQLFDNWSGSGVSSETAPLTFTMTSNLTLTATFATNYFPYVQGTYYGLYYPNNEVNLTNSGYVSLKLNPSGTFTGTLTLSGRPVTLGGLFRPDGTEQLAGQIGDVVLFVGLSVDLTNGTGTMTGSITNTTTSLEINWLSDLLAYRGVTKLSSVTNFAGISTTRNFVLTISGVPTETNLPAGDGYASMSITPAGLIQLAGLLPDNSSFAQSVGLSQQGIWPFYVSLYKNQGVIFGWETNTSPTNFGGVLGWIKPAVGGAYYPHGFVTNFNSSVQSYSRPSPGGQYVMVLGGGTLVGTLTNSLTVSAVGQFVPAAGTTDKLKITLVTTTGVLSGQFVNPATGKTITFKGAFSSPSAGGSGYTLDSDGQTGYFQLELAPVSSQ